MLDLEKRYFVAAGENLRNVLESWATENTMKLKGEDVSLSMCRRAYELDVQDNDDLKVALGVGNLSFLNGKRVIGRVKYDELDEVKCVVVYPEIRDR